MKNMLPLSLNTSPQRNSGLYRDRYFGLGDTVSIVDLDGLTSAEMSGATGLSWEQRAAYLETENPDWIITRTGSIEISTTDGTILD